MLPGGTMAAWSAEMEAEEDATKRVDEHEYVAEDDADGGEDGDYTRAKRHKSGD